MSLLTDKSDSLPLQDYTDCIIIVRQVEVPVMPSWKEISQYQRTAQIAEAAKRFREEQEAERRRPPADVFISYSSQDREKARLLSTKLAEAEVAHFLDEKEMKPGEEIPSVLEEEIRKRGYYLLLLSKHSAGSQWVTYEWALAKGAGCHVRILRLESDVIVPAPLSSFVAGDDIEEEVLYYANKQYDRLSLQVLLRDILRPESLSAALKFRRVPGNDLLWEHPDIGSWPEEDRELALKRQFDLANDPSPRVARIELRLNETPPQLILHCELVQAFQLSIAPKGSYITLTDWWGLRGDRTVIVHPAFWRAALEELVSLLDGKRSLLTEIENRFPVAWA